MLLTMLLAIWYLYPEDDNDDDNDNDDDGGDDLYRSIKHGSEYKVTVQ